MTGHLPSKMGLIRLWVIFRRPLCGSLTVVLAGASFFPVAEDSPHPGSGSIARAPRCLRTRGFVHHSSLVDALLPGKMESLGGCEHQNVQCLGWFLTLG